MSNDITAFINVASVGALGYLAGVVTKADPKITALVWLVAEAAVQVFQRIKGFEENRLENHVRVVIGGVACIYLNDQKQINKTIDAIFTFMAFCIIPDILARIIGRVVVVHQRENV